MIHLHLGYKTDSSSMRSFFSLGQFIYRDINKKWLQKGHARHPLPEGKLPEGQTEDRHPSHVMVQLKLAEEDGGTITQNGRETSVL